MPASDSFNAASTKKPERYFLEAISDHVIRATQQDSSGYTTHVMLFDYLSRLVIVYPRNDSAGAATIPFADFDAGSLEWHYNQLKAAGRNPRAPDGILDKPEPPAKGGGLAL